MVAWIADCFEEMFDFSNALNTSIAAGWMILAVILLRFLLRNTPKWISIMLWGFVAIRLLLPFSMESVFSLVPSSETIPQEILRYEGNQLQASAHLNLISNPIYSGGVQIELEQTVDHMQVQMFHMTVLWLLGIAVFLLYAIVSYCRISKKVTTAVLYQDNIFQSEYIRSPFVLGILRPKIYLPYTIKKEHFDYVIAHEQAHIHRKDHWWKLLGFLLRTLYWFHPLMWLAYTLFCRDIELACDEKVIQKWNNEQKATYTEALLACSMQHHIRFSCPLAFGEIGVKERVKAIMHYKKPTVWILASAILICMIVAVCFLTDPMGSSVSIRNPWVQEYDSENSHIIGNVEKEAFESISQDFSIGADKYGRAVFKDPQKAFDTLKKQYAIGLEWIQDCFDLAPLTHNNYSVYKTYGWQVTGGTKEAQEQAQFITKFLDIYENSFTKVTPTPNVETTTPDINTPEQMVMINGELYFNTGCESTLQERCGMMDGTITSTVAANEIPTNDNQSNFGIEYGYQYGATEGRIEICINDKWYVFATKEVLETLQSQSNESTSLEDAISTAILQQYTDHVTTGNILVESHVILANEILSGTPTIHQTNHIEEETVYLLVFVQEYSTYDGILQAVGGSYIPAAITFFMNDSNTYELKEYWEPRDGIYYAEDIRSKFPKESAEDALKKQQDYIEDLKAECYSKALAHLERTGTLEVQISDSLNTIVFDLLASSSFNETIDTQHADYQKLISYGAYTLRYCFKEFLQEKQTKLQYTREYVMANICQEIALEWGEAILFSNTETSSNGREWFDAFLGNAKALAKQYDNEELEKMYPASFLLLQMDK